MEFYKILNSIMENKNLSIPEVARKCNLADSTIRSIITRKTKKVSLDVAFKLSKGLNVTLEELNGDVSSTIPDYTSEEQQHIEQFRKLNIVGRKKVSAYTNDLIDSGKYEKSDPIPINKKKEIWEEEGKEHLMPIACHDDNLTEEEKAQMDKIINDYLKNNGIK